MSRKLNMTGGRYGNLLVIGEMFVNRNRQTMWECACDCGATTVVAGYLLKRGHTRSCGCLRSETNKSRSRDLTGMVFGRLTVMCKKTSGKWLCECTCGNESEVSTCSLVTSNTRSCGCLRVESSTGCNNYNWEGGISSENDKARHTKAMRIWRSEVFSDSEFTCQKCNRGGKLNAHHIKSFSRYPEYRDVVENGACLCEGCHKKFHHIYGTKYFTDGDYFNWLKGADDE